MIQKDKYKNATLLDNLGNLIGSEGIKTDVAITIEPATVPILIGSILIAVVAGILIAGAIQSIFKKK